MNEITILDKTYISSKQAAEITGYAKDYVGQLCREGHVEAKMVGRSWYVYEPSIRKHRFGADEPKSVAANTGPGVSESSSKATQSAPLVPATPAWEPSVYKSEPIDMIPELQTPVQNINRIPDTQYATAGESEDAHETLTDMQSAWREWFDRKQELRIESPAVIDARNEEVSEIEDESDEESELMLPSGYGEHELASEAPHEDFSIPIHRIEDKEEEEFSVPIQRIAPVRLLQTHPAVSEGVIREERIIKRGSRRPLAKKRTNAPAIAGLIALSMIAIAIAVIGTGHADKYLGSSVSNNPVVNFLVGNSSFNK